MILDSLFPYSLVSSNNIELNKSKCLEESRTVCKPHIQLIDVRIKPSHSRRDRVRHFPNICTLAPVHDTQNTPGCQRPRFRLLSLRSEAPPERDNVEEKTKALESENFGGFKARDLDGTS